MENKDHYNTDGVDEVSDDFVENINEPLKTNSRKVYADREVEERDAVARNEFKKEDRGYKEPEKEVIIQEKIVYRDRRSGCFGLGCGCRSLGCFGCLGLLLLCAGIIFVIINRPPFIWNSVVDFLNNDAKYPEVAQMSSQKAEADILAQVKTVGQNDIYITEDMLTSIARERIKSLRDVAFDIEADKIIMYWKFDASERPVYGNAEFTLDKDSAIKVTKVGTPRVTFPEFVNNGANSLINSTLSAGDGNLISNLVSNNDSFKVNEIKLLEDKIYVNAFVNLNLF